MDTVVAAIGGLLIGSFLNVVVWRLPRHESLAAPGSHCPACGAPVKPYDNIPVVSWLLLRAKCRHCGTHISARYPAVELLTAALTTVVAVAKHGAHDIALGEVLVLILIPVAFIDLEHRKIPNVITAPAAALAVVIGLITHPAGVPEQLIAGAAAGMFFFLFALAWPAGMGMGDVKLAGVLGLFLGRDVVVSILAALIGAVAVGVGVMGQRGVAAGRKTALPLGPFLAVGAVVGVLAGPALTHWYLHTVL